MSTIAVVTMLLIIVLGVPFTLWWWKLADRWASDEHKRFTPKPGPPTLRPDSRPDPRPDLRPDLRATPRASDPHADASASPHHTQPRHTQPGPPPRQGNPFARGSRRDASGPTQRIVIEGFDDDPPRTPPS